MKEYVTVKTSTPYTRVSCRDRHVALTCNSDIQCPIGSRCYTPVGFPDTIGVCVVTYDSQLLVEKIDKIWDT